MRSGRSHRQPAWQAQGCWPALMRRHCPDHRARALACRNTAPSEQYRCECRCAETLLQNLRPPRGCCSCRSTLRRARPCQSCCPPALGQGASVGV